MYNTLITSDRLNEIIRFAKISPENGFFAEAGVYKGGCLKYIAEYFPTRDIIGFDSFEGLPKEDWSKNEIHQPNDFNDTSFNQVKEYLKDYNIQLIKGYFPDSAEPFKDFKFSFVHIDFDFYEGVKNAIKFFYPKMLKNGIIVLDDYLWGNCPGVEKALINSGLNFYPTNAKFQAYIQKI